MPSHALLNDANPHLINFYRWLHQGLRATVRMAHEERLFYRNRARFNELLRNGRADSSEAAGLFYYLNRSGYNGLCRFNRQGEFNVPFGQYKSVAYVRDFSDYSARFADWTFSVGDFEQIPLRPTDFIYADPPYDVEFTQYAQGGFSWADQVRAAEFLARHPGPVVLVNQATPRIKDLYSALGYTLDYLDAPRRISCNGDRKPAREVIATLNLK
jgi:DNA adenine methylase